MIEKAEARKPLVMAWHQHGMATMAPPPIHFLLCTRTHRRQAGWRTGRLAGSTATQTGTCRWAAPARLGPLGWEKKNFLSHSPLSECRDIDFKGYKQRL